MSGQVAPGATPTTSRPGAEPLRVAFLGSSVWLDGCAPAAPAHGLIPHRVDIACVGDVESAMSATRDFDPDVTVLFVPTSLPAGALNELPGVSLGVLVESEPAPGLAELACGLDRLVSFFPALTGRKLGSTEVWRAVPPPVADGLFGDVRPLRGKPLAMSLGAASYHREWMLLYAKHHHDLLQVVHGVSGDPLVELLREYDVGVHVPREPGGAFGHQVGMHLAAGHLLLTEAPNPAHGLERDIDYLHVDSPEGLSWTLERLGRFPEMYQRIRIRGRLKAEQYRASRLFARLTHDLLADVRAFGSERSRSS
jgi:hypothetical protein